MKNCEDCGKEIDDKYKVCVDCNEKRKVKGNGDTLKMLEKINWNLGTIALSLKAFITYEMLKEVEGKESFEVKSKISEFFQKDLEKSLKFISDIREENENKRDS